MPRYATPVDIKRYRRTVESLGNKTQVAKALGIARELLSRRCHGHTPVDREAYIALRYLKTQFFPVRRRRERERAAIKPHTCFLR